MQYAGLVCLISNTRNIEFMCAAHTRLLWTCSFLFPQTPAYRIHAVWAAHISADCKDPVNHLGEAIHEGPVLEGDADVAGTCATSLDIGQTAVPRDGKNGKFGGEEDA